MPARLVPLISGAAPPIPLERPVLLIGRHPECDISLNLPQISRRHCCVAQASARLVIRDLGSRNGTFLNTLPARNTKVHAGDEIRAGVNRFKIEQRA